MSAVLQHLIYPEQTNCFLIKVMKDYPILWTEGEEADVPLRDIAFRAVLDRLRDDRCIRRTWALLRYHYIHNQHLMEEPYVRELSYLYGKVPKAPQVILAERVSEESNVLGLGDLIITRNEKLPPNTNAYQTEHMEVEKVQN
ncbi:hypothetical protein QR680_000231 [Steinernema hermaphroditum]|uniref:Uncharacterized protein n=1 Tax=Steinernema hermaphroditum TaxID=289476 RepID=A0AA39GWN3_9BILA|nr:hypothetical protein QR680_000231 [Steinernema hermaphroditum]